MEEVQNWSCDDVGKWLSQNGFACYRDLFCRKHKIDGKALLTLTEADLVEAPLEIPVLGDVKRLVLCISSLHKENRHSLKSLGIKNGVPFQYSPRHAYNLRRSYLGRLDSVESSFSEESHDLDEQDHDQITPLMDLNNSLSNRPVDIDPELWKTLLSFLYVFSVFLLTSFIMVIVHERVPDVEKYPPLPDLFLDNIPFIPWAFKVCEVIGVIFGVIWAAILFFHKHRFILLRRMFSLTGTVFLLRSVTMLITSLSVPSPHLKCKGAMYGDFWAKLNRTLQIWRGLGMSIVGVDTCGDYMFSGHTAILTMFNFFISEYTPRGRMYYLHTMTWVLNMFGIFFILAAHEHYSIDVFIAFYITTRLFLYYHTLANNRALMRNDTRRAQIWFPLFTFFESKCQGIVPNHYEWPLPWPKSFKSYFDRKCHSYKKVN